MRITSFYSLFCLIWISALLLNFGMASGSPKEKRIAVQQLTGLDNTLLPNTECSVTDLKTVAQSNVRWYVAYQDGRLIGGSDPLGYGSDTSIPHEAEDSVKEVDLSVGAMISATISASVGDPFAHMATAVVTATAMISDANIVVIELNYALSGSGNAPQIDDPDPTTDLTWSRSGPSAVLEFFVTPSSGEGVAKFTYDRIIDTGNSSKSNFASTSFKQGDNTLFSWILEPDDTTAELTSDVLPDGTIHVNLNIGASSSMWSEPRNFLTSGTVRYEFPCTSTDVAVEIEPMDSAEIVCKPDGNLALPVEAKVTYSGGSEPLEDVSVSVGRVNGPRIDATIDSIAPNTSETVQVDVDVADFVSASNGSFGELTLEATVNTTGVFADQNEGNNRNEIKLNGNNITLGNPRQYVRGFLKRGQDISGGTSDQDNVYWIQDQYTMVAKFFPRCGEKPGNYSEIPLKTLGKALDPRIEHFNWLQTVTFPSNWTTYTVAASDVEQGRIEVSCTGRPLNLDENYLRYVADGRPVDKTLMSTPYYDPPVSNSLGRRLYLFGIDGPDPDDLCWGYWLDKDGKFDQYVPYLSQQDLNTYASKFGLGFDDTPQQSKWTLTYRTKDDPSDQTNQFIRFETRLVGVTASEEVVENAIFDGFTWKSNTVTTTTGFEGGIIVPSAANTEMSVEGVGASLEDELVLEGGIFDVEPFTEARLSYAPSMLSIEIAEDSMASDKLTLSAATTDAQISWSAAVSADWLTLSEMSGTTPSDIDVSANSSGMASGIYTATLNFSTDIQTETVPVILIVRPGDQDPNNPQDTNIYIPYVAHDWW